jgi:hypothetical protein
MNLGIFGRAPYIYSEGCGKVRFTLPHITNCQICIRPQIATATFAETPGNFAL